VDKDEKFFKYNRDACPANDLGYCMFQRDICPKDGDLTTISDMPCEFENCPVLYWIGCIGIRLLKG